jgi:HPt (histidine-containing phosphotransfer) domain-containing protein
MKNLTDLSYLREIAAGDDLFIQEIIQTFIRQVPEFSEKMRTYLREEAFSQLAKGSPYRKVVGNYFWPQ